MSYYAESQKKYRSKSVYSGIARTAQIGRRRRNTIFVVKYLATHPCVRCGQTDMLVLEFHHRNPKTKKRSISEMFHNGDSLKTLEKEIKKCDVLCANCKRKNMLRQLGSKLFRSFCQVFLLNIKESAERNNL